MRIRFSEKWMLAFLALGPLSLAAKTNYGQGGDYLQYGTGARALGMGSAFTGVADDGSAEYWNPAGLAFLEEFQFQTMYAPFNLGTDLYSVSLAAPWGTRAGTLAVSDLLLRSGGFQRRDDLNFVSGGNGEVSHNALSIAYGHSFREVWSAGVRARALQQKVLGDSGSAFALDLSGYSRPYRGVTAGVALSNLNRPEISLGQDPDLFRPNARLGLAYHAPRERVVFSVDVNKMETQSAYVVAGLEFNLSPLFALRAGWDRNQRVTAGLGLALRSFRFDYAYADQEDLGAVNRVSLTLRWANIYRAEIAPIGLGADGESLYMEGLKNEVKFRVDVPKLKIAHWTLILKDADGKVVRTLSEQYHPGTLILWDMTDENGRPVKRGIYSYRFAVEYKSGRVWEEEGRLRLDYKSNSVPGVELRLRAAEGLEGSTGPSSAAPTVVPPVPSEPAPASAPTPLSEGR